MQQYVVDGVLQHATINEVLDEHEVAERRSIMFQAHGHAIILSIAPSTLEVQEETSIMSRIMSTRLTEYTSCLAILSTLPINFSMLVSGVEREVEHTEVIGEYLSRSSDKTRSRSRRQ